MCQNCENLCERVNIFYPYQLFHIVETLKELIKDGTIVNIGGNCGLDDIKKNAPWPDDIIEIKFKCSNCNQKFILVCETYHGRGGKWDVDS